MVGKEGTLKEERKTRGIKVRTLETCHYTWAFSGKSRLTDSWCFVLVLVFFSTLDDYITDDLCGCKCLFEKKKKEKTKLTALMIGCHWRSSFFWCSLHHISFTERIRLPVGIWAFVHPVLTHEGTTRADLGNVQKTPWHPSARMPRLCVLPNSSLNSCGQATLKDTAKPVHTEEYVIISNLRLPSPSYGCFLKLKQCPHPKEWVT